VNPKAKFIAGLLKFYHPKILVTAFDRQAYFMEYLNE
jgi:hypothetical protein